MKKTVVCGAGGFIGGHLVNRLQQEGHWVRGVISSSRVLTYLSRRLH